MFFLLEVPLSLHTAVGVVGVAVVVTNGGQKNLHRGGESQDSYKQAKYFEPSFLLSLRFVRTVAFCP